MSAGLQWAVIGVLVACAVAFALRALLPARLRYRFARRLEASGHARAADALARADGCAGCPANVARQDPPPG